MIPAAATEAAHEQLDAMGSYVPRKYIEAALEAAAPHMAAQTLLEAADVAVDRTHGLDGHEARTADKRGYMQRHNVTAAARWLRVRAEALKSAT